jgi:hypothetical protein
MVGFVDSMIEKYVKLHATDNQCVDASLGIQFKQEFDNHYKQLWDRDIAKERVRKLPHLSSVQTNLSHFKRRLRDLMLVPVPFLKELRMTYTETRVLQTARNNTARMKAIDLPLVDADKFISDCRVLLYRKDPYIRVMALACLTGRRTAELLFSMTFNPPRDEHFTHSRYDDTDPLVSREIPMFVDRLTVVDAVTQLRQDLPCRTVQDVNAKYGKGIQRIMYKYAPTINNIHGFRKMYVLTCFDYFNERHCSIVRLASDYLCHKTLSDTVLTYLSCRVKVDKSLDFST